MKTDKNIEKLLKELVKKDIVKYNDGSYFINDNMFLNIQPISLGFENVAIKQKKNICTSRLDVNVDSEIIKGITRKPLIASNMSTVCDSSFCISLYKNGCLGVMHRADSDDVLCKETKKISKECEWTAVSVGVGDDQYDLAKKLIKFGANIIFIDIAHGYSDSVLDLGKKIKYNFPHVKVVVGNTTNTEMLLDVCSFADAIKVGIAQGFACETKNTAGCTEKQFSAILKFKHLSKKYGIPIISDGGVREGADLVKAIGAGANSIMAGKIFAACPESAAEVLEINNKPKKVYAGMACYSHDTQILTESGWKYFYELDNDRVVTLDKNNVIEFHRPDRYFEYDYTGEMIKTDHAEIDLLVTPNHRMYVRDPALFDGEYKFVNAIDCIKRGFVYKTGGWDGDHWEYYYLDESNYSQENYEGKVYCVEVKNNVVCVRRNKKHVWCGNSRYVQNRWKGHLKDGTCPEGGIRYLDVGESIDKLITRYLGSLRSGITYAGGKDIESFQENVEFIRIQ